MIPTLRERDREEILLWMAAIDAALAEGNFTFGEELDARLEQRLEDLDHRLNDLDEAGDVLDGDNHVGIEDQFIAAWSQVLSGTGSFAPPGQDAQLAAHLRNVLSDEALTGPYAPRGRSLERTPASHPGHEVTNLDGLSLHPLSNLEFL